VPVGKFVVRLDERWCDCGKFQKLHLPCSHVIAACKHAHHDFSMYISQHYRLDVIVKVYDNLFGELRHEEYWPPYQGPQVWPHPATKRTERGRPKSSRIRTKMDIREEEDNEESVPIVELKDTQEIIVLITLHFHDLHQTT